MVKNANVREDAKTQNVSHKEMPESEVSEVKTEPKPELKVYLDVSKLEPVVKDALYKIGEIRAVMKTGKRSIKSLLGVLTLNLTDEQINIIRRNGEVIFMSAEDSTKSEVEPQ